jgi:hypothetical protein
MRWIVALLLLTSLVGCASQPSGPQAGGWRLPNCQVSVYGSRPVWGCHTGGMTIPVGRYQ